MGPALAISSHSGQLKAMVPMQHPSSLLETVVALIVAASCVACSTQPLRSEAERAADENVAAQVETALQADPSLYARHIDVTVDRGVVHLGGFVWSAEELRLARYDAASVAGVKTVSPEMELIRGGITGTAR